MKPPRPPSTLKVWLIVAFALLDEVAALVLVFVILWAFDVSIPVAAMVAIGLVVGAFGFIVHRALVPSLRRRKITGAEGMLGATGEVTAALRPSGTVKIGDEYWQAKSVAGDIRTGEDVEVVAIDGLKLEVRRKSRES
jgi:membrane-bound ClpP family serine protease